MATRRARLKDILVAADEDGATVADLVSSIERFTAEGGSGIENYLSFAESNPVGSKASANAAVVEQIKSLLDTL